MFLIMLEFPLDGKLSTVTMVYNLYRFFGLFLLSSTLEISFTFHSRLYFDIEKNRLNYYILPFSIPIIGGHIIGLYS